jgi:serine/threonine protein phosphatase PrpC
MITCKPDVRRVERSKEDEFILCGCDGIWERYVDNNQGIIDIVREQFKRGDDRTRILEDLLETLIARDTTEGVGCDNMTAILVSLAP